MIYLLLGPEEGEKNDWLQREKERISREHPDVEISTFFGGDEDGRELSLALSQSSLFSSFRLVIVKHYENVKKTDDVAKAIAEFAKGKGVDAELIILSQDTSTTAFPKEAVDKAKNTTLKFWELDDEKKKAWIRSYSKKEGFLITNSAIDEILLSVDNNTAEMKSLVSSIINFLRISKKESNTVDIDAIEAYTTRTKGENGFTLFKAMAERNLEKSLMIANSIMLSDIRETIPAFSVLANQFRMLEACLEMKEHNMLENDILKNATYVPTSGYSKRAPTIFFKDYNTFRKAMKSYTLADARRIIIYIGEKDSEIKSASTDMTKLAFESAIYDIVVNGGARNTIKLEAMEL